MPTTGLGQGPGTDTPRRAKATTSCIASSSCCPPAAVDMMRVRCVMQWQETRAFVRWGSCEGNFLTKSFATYSKQEYTISAMPVRSLFEAT